MKLQSYTFKLNEDRAASIHVLNHRGREVWITQEVGAALGYSDPGKLTDNINEPWSDDFIAERDFFKVEGEELAALKRLGTVSVPSSPDQEPIIHPFARSLLLLTESGVNLACTLARTPAARLFRRWLADEVLPSIRRTGSYTATEAQKPHGAPVSLEARRLVLGECKLMQRTLVELARTGALSPAQYAKGLAEIYARMAVHLGMRPVTLLEFLDSRQERLIA
jgi:prophage antirepressor-like protein